MRTYFYCDDFASSTPEREVCHTVRILFISVASHSYGDVPEGRSSLVCMAFHCQGQEPCLLVPSGSGSCCIISKTASSTSESFAQSLLTMV